MIFSEMPIGSKFRLGSIEFTKINDEGMSVTLELNEYLYYDHPRGHSGKNKYERESGTKFFFDSSVYKYLNCDDRSWAQVEEGDYTPYDPNRSGFLHYFDDEDAEYLEPYDLKVDVPDGYIRKYGETVTKSVTVGLPDRELSETITEVTGRHFSSWLCVSGSMPCRWRWGNMQTVNGRSRENVVPVVKIKADAPIDLDSNGNFVIRIPISDFDGNLDDFLGMM